MRFFLLLCLSCFVLECRAISYTFHALTGSSAGGSFLIDDDFGFDRMSFYAETPLGTFNQPLDYMGVAHGEASAEGDMLFVNGGALGGAVFSDFRTFLGVVAAFTTDIYGICTWTFSHSWQGQEYLAGGTGVWLRSDLSPEEVATEISVPDGGATALLLLIAFSLIAFARLRSQAAPERAVQPWLQRARAMPRIHRPFIR